MPVSLPFFAPPTVTNPTVTEAVVPGAAGDFATIEQGASGSAFGDLLQTANALSTSATTGADMGTAVDSGNGVLQATGAWDPKAVGNALASKTAPFGDVESSTIAPNPLGVPLVVCPPEPAIAVSPSDSNSGIAPNSGAPVDIAVAGILDGSKSFYQPGPCISAEPASSPQRNSNGAIGLVLNPISAQSLEWSTGGAAAINGNNELPVTGPIVSGVALAVPASSELAMTAEPSVSRPVVFTVPSLHPTNPIVGLTPASCPSVSDGQTPLPSLSPKTIEGDGALGLSNSEGIVSAKSTLPSDRKRSVELGSLAWGVGVPVMPISNPVPELPLHAPEGSALLQSVAQSQAPVNKSQVRSSEFVALTGTEDKTAAPFSVPLGRLATPSLSVASLRQSIAGPAMIQEEPQQMATVAAEPFVSKPSDKGAMNPTLAYAGNETSPAASAATGRSVTPSVSADVLQLVAVGSAIVRAETPTMSTVDEALSPESSCEGGRTGTQGSARVETPTAVSAPAGRSVTPSVSAPLPRKGAVGQAGVQAGGPAMLTTEVPLVPKSPGKTSTSATSGSVGGEISPDFAAPVERTVGPSIPVAPGAVVAPDRGNIVPSDSVGQVAGQIAAALQKASETVSTQSGLTVTDGQKGSDGSQADAWMLNPSFRSSPGLGFSSSVSETQVQGILPSLMAASKRLPNSAGESNVPEAPAPAALSAPAAISPRNSVLNAAVQARSVNSNIAVDSPTSIVGSPQAIQVVREALAANGFVISDASEGSRSSSVKPTPLPIGTVVSSSPLAKVAEATAVPTAVAGTSTKVASRSQNAPQSNPDHSGRHSTPLGVQATPTDTGVGPNSETVASVEPQARLLNSSPAIQIPDRSAASVGGRANPLTSTLSGLDAVTKSAISSSSSPSMAGDRRQEGGGSGKKDSQVNGIEDKMTSNLGSGIASASGTDVMSSTSRPAHEGLRAADLLGSASASSGASSPTVAASPASSVPTENVSRTLQVVRDVSERIQTKADQTVQFSVSFRSGENLSVSLEYRGGVMHTRFNTDSSELRNAITRDWQNQMPSSVDGDHSVRLAPPSFGSGQTSPDSLNSGGQQRQQQQAFQQQAGQDAMSRARMLPESSKSTRQGASLPAPAAEEVSSLRPLVSDISRHLQTFA